MPISGGSTLDQVARDAALAASDDATAARQKVDAVINNENEIVGPIQLGSLTSTASASEIGTGPNDIRALSDKVGELVIFDGATPGGKRISPFQGSLNCSTNPNFPNAAAGWWWIVPNGGGGKIGGASGKTVSDGDKITCITDTPGGTQGATGGSWHIESASSAIISVASNTAKLALSGISAGQRVKITGEAGRVEDFLGGAINSDANWIVIGPPTYNVTVINAQGGGQDVHLHDADITIAATDYANLGWMRVGDLLLDGDDTIVDLNAFGWVEGDGLANYFPAKVDTVGKWHLTPNPYGPVRGGVLLTFGSNL